MRGIALGALLLAACGSGSGAPPATAAPTSVAANATNSPCPSSYPVSDVHGELLWQGDARVVSIVSVSDGLFTATLVSANAFTTDPLRLHFNDAGRSAFPSYALRPGDVVHLRLLGRSDDCSYQVSAITKTP